MDNCSLLRVLINAKGSAEIGVSGSSMSPFLFSGDMTMITPCAELAVGDLVVFPGGRSGEPVLHRVALLADGGVTVVGDNACVASAMPISQLIGQVTKVRFGKREEWCSVSHPILAGNIARLSYRIAVDGDNVASLKSKRYELSALLRAELGHQDN